MNTNGPLMTLRKGSTLHAQLTARIIKNLNEAGIPEMLAQLVQELQSVDENAPDAALNATSILDSEGRRIELVNGPIISKDH